MNSENIGKFIRQLREEKGLTQEELANKVHIGREAISKWERGKTSPDSSILLILSETFDVTVNEILVGERKTDKNITLELYDDRNKLGKNLKKLIAVIFVIIFVFLILFLSYYFINQYKSVHAYTITGFSDNFEITNGLFVKTNGKMYFNLGNIDNKEEVNIESLELYYIDDKVKKVICTTESADLSFVDYKGYEEYINLSKIENIIDNLYLNIYYKEDNEIIKLNLIEDYVNDNFLFINDKDISNNKIFQINDITSIYLINLIKDEFTLTETGYQFELVDDEKIITLDYFDSDNLLNVSIIKNKKILEEYYFDMNYLTLNYHVYDESNYNFSITLKSGIKCEEKQCEKIDEFIDILNRI